MTTCWVLGAGVESRMGAGVAATVEALRQGPPAPQMLRLPAKQEEAVIPCHLMPSGLGAPPEARLEDVVRRVTRDALAQAGISDRERARTGLFLGTSSLDVSITEDAYDADLRAGLETHPLMANSCMGETGRRVARLAGVGGPDFTINTACTASANALFYAAAMVASGRIDHALVVGLELFNRVTALGFSSLDLLSPSGMRPFDPSRSGLVLGEAVAAVVIGRERPSPTAFGLAGSANLCDTHSISAARPDGSTVADVMRRALASAGLAPDDILAVKAHGTASLLNDEAEAAGLLAVFGSLPPVVALKPFIGHTFGACGLTELVMMTSTAQAGFLPGTPGISRDAGDTGVALTQGPTPVGAGAMLLNYFGFGGNNTSLVVSNA